MAKKFLRIRLIKKRNGKIDEGSQRCSQQLLFPKAFCLKNAMWQVF
jgi:hypothetical protein